MKKSVLKIQFQFTDPNGEKLNQWRAGPFPKGDVVNQFN